MDTGLHRQIDLDDFYTMIAVSVDGFNHVNFLGEIVEVNDSYCRMLGYNRTELLQMHMSDIDVFDSADDVAKRLEEIRRKGSLRFETKQLHKNGSFIDVEVCAHYVAAHGGAFFAFVRDITQLKRTEQALEDAKQLYESLFYFSPEILALTSEKDGRYIAVNSAHDKATGYSAAELIGHTSIEMNIWSDSPSRRHVIEELREHGTVHCAEVRFRRRSGEEFPALLSLSPVEICGERCMICVVTDITNQKNAEREKLAFEQQLQHTQKLESLGVLAGGIAHDFNNLLAVIIGHCSLAKLKPSKVLDRIQPIETAAKHAAELCQQMLAYAGKGNITKSPVNIADLVAEMVKMSRSTIGQNIKVISDLDSRIPPIIADASQIRQITMNLIINAAEAIGASQGTVRVALAQLCITDDQAIKDHLGNDIPPGRYACLEVSDTGCGMDAKTQQRIFEPFYTTKFVGRGLGMSAVLGIIKAHSGALYLFSQPGQGTTFKVYLPIAASGPAGQPSSRPASPDSWRGSGIVLLVEDEEEVANVAAKMLEEMGFKVIKALDGQEALELYSRNLHSIALVVTDIDMPVMDGYELIRELRKISLSLPIVISSGLGGEDISLRIAPIKIEGLIGKPYDFSQFCNVLKDATKGAKEQ